MVVMMNFTFRCIDNAIVELSLIPAWILLTHVFRSNNSTSSTINLPQRECLKASAGNVDGIIADSLY